MKLTRFALGSNLECGTELVEKYKVLSKSSPIARETYFLLKSVIVKGGLKIDESEEVAYGCEHALADMVSLIFQSSPSFDCG